jgi:tetratricopeptide (TPR) repeat protein
MNVLFKALISVGLIGFLIAQAVKMGPEYEPARTKALNAVHPKAFNGLIAAVEHAKPLSPKELRAYQDYFAELAKHSPDRADALAMQGFCAFHLNKEAKAVEFYQKAAGLVPGFYGFRYNLAVIYFKTGRFEDASRELQQALASDPKESLMYILSQSKIYGLIMLARFNDFGKPMPVQLSEGYQKAYALMVMTQYRLQTGQLPAGQMPSLEIF